MTDLGTEFGVEVDRQGYSNVHVFLGVVEVAASDGDEGWTSKMRLTGGESVRVERDKQRVVVKGTVQSSDFVRAIPYVDPRAYAKTVLADGPLFYWTFDEPAGPAIEQVRHLAPQALFPQGGAGRCTHAVIQSGLALGRAADFSKAAGCFSAWEMQQGEMPGAWAIEFWMQLTGDLGGYTRQYLLNAGGPGWGRWNNPAIIFDVGEAGGADNELELFSQHGRTTDGPRLSDDKWHHVILVFFGDGEKLGVAPRVDIIVDGQSMTVNRGNCSSPFQLNGQLFVGASGDRFQEPFKEPLCGRLDELAFYDLSNRTVQEIETQVAAMARRHVAAARTKTQPGPFARDDSATLSSASKLPDQTEATTKNTKGEHPVGTAVEHPV